jgi:hypothetical protein
MGLQILNDKKRLLAYLLAIFFLFDVLNVLLFKTRFVDCDFSLFQYLRLSAIPKGIVFIVLGSRLRWCGLSYKGIMVVLYLLFSILSSISFNSIYSQFSWFVLLIKYMFPVVLYYYFKNINSDDLVLAQKVFLSIIILQVVFVLTGYVLDLEFLSSYGLLRFGFSGLIFSVNEVSFFYSIAGVFLILLWYNEGRHYYLIVLFFVVACGLLSGTKAFFISGFFISILLFYVVKQKLGYRAAGAALVVILILFIAFLNFSPVVDFYLSFMKNKGILSMLTSFRSDLVVERLPELYSKWEIWNVIFGGMNPQNQLVEMDLLDLFSFGGVLGFIIYFWFMKSTVFAMKNNVFIIILFLSWLITGALAGHVFNSGITSLYLVICSLSIQKGLSNSVKCTSHPLFHLLPSNKCPPSSPAPTANSVPKYVP